nr:MAG TPA: hypothetical protein [Caudoviricetes sp.]
MFNGRHIALEQILQIKYHLKKQMRCNMDL